MYSTIGAYGNREGGAVYTVVTQRPDPAHQRRCEQGARTWPRATPAQAAHLLSVALIRPVERTHAARHLCLDRLRHVSSHLS